MLSIVALTLALTTPDYRDTANWLCRPGREDACSQDISTTVIAADGTRTLESFVRAKEPKFDCFYVYPTISLDPTPNSDMVAGPEEGGVARIQVERFTSQCRVFAPVYRQVTLTALRQLMTGEAPAIDRDMAYADVKAAWDDYLEHDNHGRGVVLIGHSQGSLILTQLVAREIDGKPVADRLISAMLIGSAVPVPIGKQVGGVFQATPLCRSATQTGCVITYASFRADSPPPPDGRFGKGDRPDMEAGCTNPAALGGGKAVTKPYLATRGTILGGGEAPRWTSDGAPVATPFVSPPGLLSAECINSGAFNYLSVTVNADPADPRTDQIDGDVRVGAVVLKQWGLHLIDMNLAQGDLVALAARQAAEWRAKHPK